jgi:hypothetical protein
MLRGLITEIRQKYFHSAKPLKFVCNMNQCKVTRVDHKNTTGRLPFCETLEVRFYFESVSRLRRSITEIRQEATLSVKQFKFIVIVNQWLGDAG